MGRYVLIEERCRVNLKKLLFLLVVGVMFLSACSEEASYETIQIDDVLAKQEEGYIVLDVREPSEYDAAHIIGAQNKPLSELQSSNFEGLNKDEQYVVICQSGNRSKQASAVLLEEGYKIVNVAQGMSSWNGDIE